MSDAYAQWSDLVLVYGAYVLATASLGPANMAIMAVAMAEGRLRGLALAAGVITGSIFWGIVAAGGLSAVLASVGWALWTLKVAGGLYLIWLSWKAGRSAMRPNTSPMATAKVGCGTIWRSYRLGLLIHLTNPKAVFAWAAIITLGLRPDASAGQVVIMLGGCAVLGTVVFAGYALLFSTPVMSRMYQRARRGIEATFALFFAAAGLRLLAIRG